jgi:parvulin-like peptidyl-prolyl isomerase
MEEAWMSSKRVCVLVGLLLLLLASVACSARPSPSAPPSATPIPQGEAATVPAPTATGIPPSPTPERPLAARVNGEPIYQADYERELQRYKDSLEAQGIDPDSREGQDKVEQARGWILNMMIEQVLTEQAARKAGVEVTEAQVDQYMEDMVAESGGEDAFRAKLEEWGETYEGARREVRAQLIGMQMTQRVVANVPESAEQVHARHILVDTEQEAKHIRSQLEAGADFAALAKAHSLDKSTRENGGDLGFFPRGILVSSEVEEAAFSLQPGQFSEVISSPLGFHIVQVVERDPNRAIGAQNLQLLREQAVQKWIEGLWAQATVERFVEVAP